MSHTGQLTLSVQLPDDETFVSYQSETNKSVAELLKQFISSSYVASAATGKESVHSFYLFGLADSGKSHLLHASCALAQDCNKTSVCLSFSELQQLSVEVLLGLENIDLVCLDDIHLIAEQPQWQQAVFDLYNRITEQGKQLIITGNKSVNELSLSLPDLRSRLSWGYVEQLKLLTDDEKLIAMQFRATQRGLLLNDDVSNFLLTRLSRNMRTLIDSLDKLDKASMREQRRITIPFIKEVLF